MIFNIGGPSPVSEGEPAFTYTGRYEIKRYGGNWEVWFYSSGTLTFSKLNGARNCDVCVVGGGGSGSNAHYSDGAGGVVGGSGGYGGQVRNVYGHKCHKSFYVTVGGPDARSVFDGFSAATNHGWGGYPFDSSAYPHKGKPGADGGEWQVGWAIDGKPGAPNTGDGGGGGNYQGYNYGSGASGGTGIIIIRNHR